MNKVFSHLQSLPACTILTTGRTGSDFLQSLLDSHPQVLTFNGHFQFHIFWRTSICVAAGKFSLEDFIEEFIGKHIEKFKSKYDLIEGKDRLGINRNQSLNIDTADFKQYFLNIMQEQNINSKNCLLGIYGAYALVLNQNVEAKKILLHHLHRHDELSYYLRDFPNSKIISMTRDPRSNYYSGVKHHKKYNPGSMSGAHHYFYIKRIFEDIKPLKKLQNDYISIKIEDLGNIKILKKIAMWLNIDYSDTMRESTWAGYIWNADRLSTSERSGVGFCSNLLNNNWQNSLSKKDMYLFNFLLNDRLKHYGYDYYERSIISYIFIPFLIFLPLDFEGLFFHDLVKKKKISYKLLLIDLVYYLKRCFYFYTTYINIFAGYKFSGNLIK